MTSFLQYCGAALVAAAVSLVTLLLQRKWKKDDDKASKSYAIMDKLNEIENKLNQHIVDSDRKDADSIRIRILRFGDEVKNGVNHTEEHWNEILDAIDGYKAYCENNPDYPNSKAVKTIERLEAVYAKLLERNDFL